MGIGKLVNASKRHFIRRFWKEFHINYGFDCGLDFWDLMRGKTEIDFLIEFAQKNSFLNGILGGLKHEYYANLSTVKFSELCRCRLIKFRATNIAFYLTVG